MIDFIHSSVYFGLVMSLVFFFLARSINVKAGREVINPLLLATVLCILVLLVFDIDFDVYYQGAQYLEVFLTPTTICLAIPLYRQYELLKKNITAVLAGCLSGVLAHMAACVGMLFLFDMESGDFISLLPKSITAAIGRPLSAELGGSSSLTMALIMITGLFGAVVAPSMIKLFRIRHPLSQGLACGTASHASGTAKAVELGDIQGAASSLAIVVTGLLTVVTSPIIAALFA